KTQGLARDHVKLGPMTRTRDDAPYEVAFDQVAAVMGAQILDAGELSVHVEDRQIEIVCVNEFETAGRNLALIGYRNPAGHERITSRVEYQLQSGPHGIITNCFVE